MNEEFKKGDLSHAPILLYQRDSGERKIEVQLDGGTVWLSQQQMTELFQSTKQNISLHINNIYQKQELEERATVKDYLTVQSEGNRKVQRSTKFYNLEVIIAVGFRVNSRRGTAFRQWAIEKLNEYLVKGFALDDERLKAGKNLGSDYFDELLERIRDIRASEKRFYQKIRDIFTLAIDYNKNAKRTKGFFQIIQNKLHWAATGMTAPELIAKRVDATKPNMNLTTWKGDKVRKADVTIAKNYLNAEEIEELNNIVVMYLDYAQDQANKRRPLYMQDWQEKLDGFLQFNEREILDNPGKVSKAVADKLAKEQYEIYHRQRLATEATEADDNFEEVVKKTVQKQ